MSSAHYKAYLRSDHWSNLRLEKLAEADARCYFCNYRSLSNHVHHVIYLSRLKETDKSHLRVLCLACHELVHFVLDNHPEINKQHRTASARWRFTEVYVKMEIGHRTEDADKLSPKGFISYIENRIAKARLSMSMAFRITVARKDAPYSEPLAEWISKNQDASDLAIVILASAIARTGLDYKRLTKKARAMQWKRYLRARWEERQYQDRKKCHVIPRSKDDTAVC